ncbi:MAG: PhnD/SsuA/transferrin family substrate-binding protein [Pseudomonadota bacterium]
MIASLPMYDRPETAAANDRLWDRIKHNYCAAGPDDETLHPPERLDRETGLWDTWLDQQLFLSQTCGLPYRAKLHGQVTLLGTPVHDVPQTPEGSYYSVLVVRASDDRESLAAYKGACIAVNDGLSQSGWAAPLAHAALHNIEFGSFLLTGGHAASAKAVADGKAEIAALDAVTWTMIQRWDRCAAHLRVLDRTAPTPALPYITARGVNTDTIRTALSQAIQDLAPADRETLCLKGLTVINPRHYLALPVPPPPEKVLPAA